MKYIKSLMQKVGKGEGGFTLIELLIVIAILGVISAVVALNIGSFLGTGTVEAANTEAHQVQTAIIAYATNSSLPSLTGGTLIPGPCVSNGTEPQKILCFLMNPGMLQAQYTYSTGGAITAANTTSGSKWGTLNFTNGSWKK